MPKKTRQEKIIARYRRQLKFFQQLQNNFSAQISSPVINKKEIKTTSYHNKKNAPESFETKDEFSLEKIFIDDFKKSLILSTLIVSFEILLFLLWR